MDRKNILVFSSKDQKFTGDILRFLHKIGLHPIEPSGHRLSWTPDTHRVLLKAMKAACAIVILLTGDDEARLRSQWYKPYDSEEEACLLPQPRLNILFAAGMASANSSKKTILVKKGQLRLCSYFTNLRSIELNDTNEQRSTLIQMLESVHCEVDLRDNAWIDTGDFSDL